MGRGGGFPGKLVAQAARQHGLFTHTQARECGVGKMALWRAARAGACERVLPRVYRLKGAATTYLQRLMAACLWAGPSAVVSHAAAARLYGLDGYSADIVEISVPGKPRRPASVARVHDCVADDRDRRTFDGVPVTSVARTLVDLAAGATVAQVAQPLDDAWRKQLVRLDYVSYRLGVLAKRGRPGVRVLRKAISHCHQRGKPLGSIIEVRSWYLMRNGGLPRPECGFPFEPLDGQPGLIDLAYPKSSLAIEVDGYAYHALTREQFEATERRASQLAALGWRVQRITRRMLDREPGKTLERIRVALATRRVDYRPMPYAAGPRGSGRERPALAGRTPFAETSRPVPAKR